MTLPSRLRRTDKPHLDLLPTVFHRLPSPHSLPSHDRILHKIVTPYNANAFETLLVKHNLADCYPFLVRNLRNGFPLGEFPDITEHVIFPIHRPSLQYMTQIDAYLAEEVSAGRMSGPFSREETTAILRGPFQCSPIVVDVQGEKLRICRHLSKGDKSHSSTNSFIDTEKFPTRFGSAAEMAEIVSAYLPYHAPFFLPILRALLPTPYHVYLIAPLLYPYPAPPYSITSYLILTPSLLPS